MTSLKVMNCLCSNLKPNQAGQAAVDYVYVVLGVALAVCLIGYGVQRDGLQEFGGALTERLLIITTILKLPI